jgi:hypothetical protein
MYRVLSNEAEELYGYYCLDGRPLQDRKAALINHTAGKVPNLFRMLETEVRNGSFQPDPDGGALAYRQLTPWYDITELVFTNGMPSP